MGTGHTSGNKHRGAKQLADQFTAAHREFYDFVKNATPEQWRAKGINHPEIRVGNEDEGRPVGTIAHHVGNGYLRNRARCQAWIRGEDPPPPSDEVNQRHAMDNPNPGHGETLRFLESEAAEMADFIRSLNDSQLAATGTFVTGPRPSRNSSDGHCLSYPLAHGLHPGDVGAIGRAAQLAGLNPGSSR